MNPTPTERAIKTAQAITPAAVKRVTEYYRFLANKNDLVVRAGFTVDPATLSAGLNYPHQRDIVTWAAQRGRGLIGASFGMMKTRIQIELLKQVYARTGKKVLIVCPLGVRHQFMVDDGVPMDVQFQYVHNDAEADAAVTPYLITNYERVRDGAHGVDIKLDSDGELRHGDDRGGLSPEWIQANIGGVCLDEAAILGNLGTLTQQAFMDIFQDMPYRWCATATPAPNDYRQLIYFADFLGVMDAGQALAQPLSAQVLTPHGWERMSTIRPGDEVIAADGSPAFVVGVYPQGKKAIYRVSFSDGSSTTCTEDHLWLTRTQYERNNERRYRLRNGTGNDGKRNGRFGTIKTTAEIASSMRSNAGGLNHDIPLVGTIKFAPRTVLVDPYLLGLLLGDGHLRDTSVYFCNADEWIIDRVRETVSVQGLQVKRHEEARLDGRPSYDYIISNGNGKGSGGGRGHHTNPVLAGLRNYGLLEKRAWNKRVPDEYLFNSPDVRLAVLQGLMDTDGTIDEANRTISFVTTSPGLADDVVFLVRSFGGIATVTCRSPHTNTGLIAGRNVQGWREQYKVTINLPAGVNPFRLPRKAERVVPKTVYAPKRYITAVEYIGEEEAQCIAVDHPEHLYVTDDLIVTHNTRFFGRNPDKAGDLQLLPHMEREFWLWVASWALFVDKPSDLGYSDDGFILPELEIRWHRLAADHQKAWDITDNMGQRYLFKNTAAGVKQAIREKRDSLSARVAEGVATAVAHLTAGAQQIVMWCDLNDEQTAIERGLKAEGITYSSIHGSLSIDETETRLYAWKRREKQALIAKPMMLGSGVNLQQAHVAIYVGLDYKFRDLIQSVHRLQRYGQMEQVVLDMIHTDAEDGVVEALTKKWSQHDALVQRMKQIIAEYGLTAEALVSGLQRSIGVDRQEVRGEYFTAVNNDTVIEAERLADDSIDLIVTSIPFGNHYEYVASLNDFGHNPTDADFWVQMDFLVPHLLRILKPGRIAAIHVKDRLLYGHQNQWHTTAVWPFSDDCNRAFIKHGFIPFGRITVATDVVRENNSTNRLGWSENCKDGTKMGVGLPEYVLLFRKPQTDISRSYADEPVKKSKADYSRMRWQVDAHSFWRSNGDRHLTPEELIAMEPERLKAMDTGSIYRWYQDFASTHGYDFEGHVALGETLNQAGKDRLPAKFGLFLPPAPVTHQERIWTDVLFMRTLNMENARRRVEKHVCPLPLDIVNRLIVRYSNPGELVLDPFGGLFTVPYLAVKLGRSGYGCELNPLYWATGVEYCQNAETDRNTPTLFDWLDSQPEEEPACVYAYAEDETETETADA